MHELQSICVYCASSNAADARYREDAARLGELLAKRNIEVVYGGGSTGSMGALADGALAAGGRVTGVIPHFMQDLEWGHSGLDELVLVEDMRARKHEMLTRSKGLVALPGGCGTFEELLEALTLKRLALFLGPIVILNTAGYYDPLIAMLGQAVDQKFMNAEHLEMWRVAETVDDVLLELEACPPWDEQARGFARSD